MEFVRLGPVDSTAYTPDILIEGYNSLIWTERFQTPGEFELKSYDIDGMMELLPEFTFVSHLETKEVMMVETIAIDWEGEGADARPEITIKGRTASTILEHRWVESSYQVKRRMRKTYSATSALCVLLYNAIANGSYRDLTRVGDVGWPMEDQLPNVVISEAVSSEGATRWWHLEQGMLWEQFSKIMVDADLGLRTIRPTYPNFFTGIEVTETLVGRGNITRANVQNSPSMRFEIYQGLDRTSSVQFSQLQGHLDKPSYLRSIAEYKTVVEVVTNLVGIDDVYRSGESTVEGWHRRTMSFDFGQPELPEKPTAPDALGRNPTAAQREAYYDAQAYYKSLKAEYDAAKANLNADFKAEGKLAAAAELKKTNKLNMVAGDISLLSPYTYKTHYDLGDMVTLLGDYGPPTPMLVQEYVRTEDAGGDRGFPGLVVPGTE